MAFVRILDGAVAEYPFVPRMDVLTGLFPEHTFSVPLTVESLAAADVFEVVEVAPPVAGTEQIAIERDPQLIGEEWTQVWALRDRTAAEFEVERAKRLVELTARYQAHVLAGWSHDFGGPGIHVLDLRPGKDDKTNWHLLLTKCTGMIAAGGSALPVKIRTAANVSFEVTAQQARDAMLAMLGWGEAGFTHKWDMDDAIQAIDFEAAQTPFADLAGIDIDAGWPA